MSAMLQGDGAPESPVAGLWRSVLEALPTNGAIIDPGGRIVAVNAAWLRFAATVAGRPGASLIGAPYSDVCGDTGDAELIRRRVRRELATVLRADQPEVAFEYSDSDPVAPRWYEIRVRRFHEPFEGYGLVLHRETTAWRTAPPEPRGPGGRRSPSVRLRRRLAQYSWPDRIRHALAEDRFVLYAQPIVDLTSGATTQHELLIRMRDEQDRIVPPGQFLPHAESCGLIREIDEWVVGEAAKLVGEGHAVELNLSAASFARRGMADVIEAALRAQSADPTKLVVEFTETALLKDEIGARRFADRIVELGVEIALDDFGTGYGGFSYLKHLPVHYLKIDREFVRDLCSDEASRHVVQAVVNLARGFGLLTVAEGVERRRTLGALKELGVDFAQGYGLGRPFPVARLRDQGA